MVRSILLLMLIGLSVAKAQVSKPANSDLNFTVTGESVDGTLTTLRLEVVGPTQSYIREASFAETLLETRSWVLQFQDLGVYSVTAIAIDAMGLRATDLGSFEITNRPPVIETFTVDNPNPEWTQSINLSIRSTDPDSNLSQLSWLISYPDGSSDSRLLWRSADAAGEGVHFSTYSFSTSLSKGLGDYVVSLTATDSEGLTAQSSQTVAPVNPSKSISVEAKGFPDPEKQIWFSESPVSSASITVYKYPQN